MLLEEIPEVVAFEGGEGTKDHVLGGVEYKSLSDVGGVFIETAFKVGGYSRGLSYRSLWVDY